MRCSGGRASRLLLVALALTTTACAPVEGPADRGPEREPVRVDESLGVVRVPAGSPVVVRMVVDGDRDPEGLGPILEAAFRTAVEDFGAVQQGFRIDLGEVVATDCSEESGDRVGRALIEEAPSTGVVALLGPQCTSTLLALQRHTAPGGLTLLTPRPQELTLTEGPDGLLAQDRAEGTWRTAPSRLAEARAAAEHAVERLALSRAATLHDGTVESIGLVEAFRSRFEALGGTVVVAREVGDALVGADGDAATAARDELLDAIAAGEVDVVFLPLPPAPLLTMVEGLGSRSGLSGAVRITTSAAATGEVFAQEAALGLLLTGPALDFTDAVSAVTGMSASQTLERVGARSGRDRPVGWWAYAYDAATLLLKAIEDSSLIDIDGSLVLSRAELRTTLARTSIGGLTGELACSALGDCAAPRIVVRRHEDVTATDLAALPEADVD